MGEILDPFSAIMVPSFNKEKCEELVEDIFNIRIDQKNRSKKIAVVGIGFSYIETNRSTQKTLHQGHCSFSLIASRRRRKKNTYVIISSRIMKNFFDNSKYYLHFQLTLSSILNHSCLRINGELDG